MVSDYSLMSYQEQRERGLMEQRGNRANTRNPHRLLKARVLRGYSILFVKTGGREKLKKKKKPSPNCCSFETEIVIILITPECPR